MQIAHMEVMERREIEFQHEKMQEKETVAKDLQARLQLERQLAEEKQKNLRLEYEAKLRKTKRVEARRLAPILESEPSGPIVAPGLSTPPSVQIPKGHRLTGLPSLCHGCQ